MVFISSNYLDGSALLSIGLQKSTFIIDPI